MIELVVPYLFYALLQTVTQLRAFFVRVSAGYYAVNFYFANVSQSSLCANHQVSNFERGVDNDLR